MRASITIACIAAAIAIQFVCAAPPPQGKVTNLPGLPVSLPSYSGYFTVNEETGSNLFFWLFQAQNGNYEEKPLLIWLNGGPGSSSMYGIFAEHGPFSVSSDGSTLVMRETSWTMEYNVMYIDNPPSGFVTNQVDVGTDLLELLHQFYTAYPNFQKLPLYITGESYAGKYVPAFAYAVHSANQAHKKFLETESQTHSQHHKKKHHQHHAKQSSRSPIGSNMPNGMLYPLTGISIGDGMVDPLTQVPGYGDLLFGLSLIDSDQRAYMTKVENSIVDMINAEEWLQAFNTFDPLMMGDEFPYGSYFNNVTGLSDYYNYDQPSYPANPWENYLNRADVKKALNVDPLYQYVSGNNTVEEYLLTDWMQSVKPWLITLLENYPVLMYSGQNDIILSAPNLQNMLATLDWPNAGDWHSAPRTVWKVNPSDSAPAGYAQQGGGLTYVIVRQAGHLVPQDQPVRAYDLITRFISGTPFTQ